MRALYFDCYAGASGDMIIGALIALGVDADKLREQLSSLGLSGYEIEIERVTRSSIAAIKFHVKVDDRDQPVRELSDIRQIINRSSLSKEVKSRSIRVFERLAEAEARVHATTRDQVHFHEVGAVDSIIDVVGAMIGFEMLGVERFLSSPLRVGRGFVETEHGLLPVPAPGTAELLRGVPVYGGDLDGEFVTPTGAAIITNFCGSYSPLPPIRISRIGYGAGARDPKGLPNALRLVLGDVPETRSQAEIFQPSYPAAADRVTVIETNIDDMNPQAYGFVMDRAFALGALDVFITPVQMKKSRPGVLLTILCESEDLEKMTEMLLVETTSLGVRYHEAKRRVLERSIETVETPYGQARIKVAREGNRTLHFQPEYDDCARLAAEAGVPLLEVQRAVSFAYSEQLKSGAEAGKANGELEKQ